MKRKRRWLRWVFLVFALLVALPLAVVWWLITSTPDFYQPLDLSDPVVLATAKGSAQKLENHVVSETTAWDQQTYQLELPEEDVNRWLAVNFPAWLRNQQVDERAIAEAEGLMVHITAEGIEVARRVAWKGFDQVARLRYTVAEPLTPDGPARLQLAGMYIGRLPIPAETVFEMIEQRMDKPTGDDAEVRARVWQLVKELPLEMPLLTRDNRWTKIDKVELSEGQATLHGHTWHDPTRRASIESIIEPPDTP